MKKKKEKFSVKKEKKQLARGITAKTWEQGR